MSRERGISRRYFMKLSAATSGGLMLSLFAPGLIRQAESAPSIQPWLFVAIDPDNTVTIGARGAEIGQGVRTSLPMLIAEELDVDWDAVRVEQLPYVVLPGEEPGEVVSKFGAQGAGGSTSIPDSWMELRQVGAKARHLLLQCAAESFGEPIDTLTTRSGHVRHPDGRKIAYGELAAAAAERQLPQEELPLKASDEFRIIGKAALTSDCHDIVTGAAAYGIDGAMPGALYAVVARTPYFEGRLGRVDSTRARAMDGVHSIVELPAPDPEEGLVRNLAAGVAVVAVDTWSALKARDALDIDWVAGPWSEDSTNALEARANAAFEGKGEIARSDGNLERARNDAEKTVDARYTMPFLAHCTMEPQNALIHIEEDKVTLIASLQSPSGASRLINEMTGIDRTRIDIRLPRSGGGFGRRLESDFVAEAVHIAQAVKQPVKLLWKREDDMQNDWYRPFGVHAMQATLSADKKVTAWSYRVAATDRRFRKPAYAEAPQWIACLDPDAFPAGCIDNYEAEHLALEFGLARGWWRGPLPTFSTFPIQSFMDEVAHAAKADPLEFRLDLLGKPRELDYRDHGGPKLHTGRLAGVLRRAAKEIDYGRKLAKGRGIGLAANFVFGGYTAHAMEVSVAGGVPRIHRCVCAIDVGQVVNPLGVEAQAMGGTIDGISTALNLEITVSDGKIEQSNFSDYRVLRMADAPDVEVHIINSGYPPSGAGEMGIPTAAPALTNAIFAATGKRIRRLPIAEQLA